MSRNPKADAVHLPPSPEMLMQMEYNKMNEDEKRRHNLARSQRMEPTGDVAPLVFTGLMLRNGIQKPPPPPPPPAAEAAEAEEENVEAASTGSGIFLGIALGVAALVSVYMGVSKLQSMLRHHATTPSVQQLVAGVQ